MADADPEQPENQDPFRIKNNDISHSDLEHKQKNQIREKLDIGAVLGPDIQAFAEAQAADGELSDWVRDLVFDEINGFRGEFRTGGRHSGAYKQGYVDREDEVFIHAPKKGDGFDEKLERVQTWKENRDTLERADQYLDQVLEKEDVVETFKQ